MKKLLTFCVLVISTCTWLGAQHSNSSDESLTKPKFGLSLNAVAFNGTRYELNGHLNTSDKTSLYAGVFGNRFRAKGFRLGVQHEVLSGKRLSLELGAGISFEHSYFRAFNFPDTRRVNVEIPIELNYRLNDKFELQFGFRPNYNLATESGRIDFLPRDRIRFVDNFNLGVKYSFGKQ